MNRFTRFLIIDKEFIFRRQREQLEEILKNSKDLHYKTLSEGELEFTPTVSFGTLSIGGFSLGVHVRVLFADLGPGSFTNKI
jgi:hypothetical protein